MAQEPDVNGKGPDAIRQDIEETRSSLTEKLETLEEQVRETVQGARASVEETIATVKGTVRDTVDTVKRTFDVSYQTTQHPWAMFGGSVLAGFVLGNVLPSVTERLEERRYEPEPSYPPQTEEHFMQREESPMGDGNASRYTEHAPARRGILSGLLDQFHDEIEQVKKMAIGAAVGVVRDYVKEQAPPSMAPQVENILDSITEKLGGKPVQGNVAESFGLGSRSRWG